MLLWILLACLTAAVAALLLWPLARPARNTAAAGGAEAAIYRDQLHELDRDKRLGLIGEEEADYARAEIGRRLIAAVDRDAAASAGATAPQHSGLALAVTVAIPAIGLCLYLLLGSPGLPAQPLAARLANPGDDPQLLLAQVERHLAQNPDDGAGWDLLAPIYLRAQRLGDAEAAYRSALRLSGESVERFTGLGETLVGANDGIVTAGAAEAFEAAARLAPEDPRARFYLALALEQAGRKDEARAAFEALAADAPSGAPWLSLVAEHIARTGSAVPSTPLADAARAPGDPGQEDVAALQALAPADRQAAIRGMVEGLAARLEEEPHNLQGWLRLVRSHSVLGDRPRAAAALARGLEVFPASGVDGQQLLALGKQLGLSSIPATGAGKDATKDATSDEPSDNAAAPARGSGGQAAEPGANPASGGPGFRDAVPYRNEEDGPMGTVGGHAGGAAPEGVTR